jgi:signal transduction histidine kinase
VASGYRELSLEAEARSARSVLLAADVDVHMDLEYGNLPVQLRTVLATILREGITNVLRHSKAEWCEVTVRADGGQVRMDIVNDGVAQTPGQPAPNSGSGIQNLSARVAALNGRLTAGLDPDGRYRLHVTAPVTVRRAAAR